MPVVFPLPHKSSAVPRIRASEVVLASLEPLVTVGLAQRNLVEPLLPPRLTGYLVEFKCFVVLML